MNRLEDDRRPHAAVIGAGFGGLAAAGARRVLSAARVLDSLLPPAAVWNPDAAVRRQVGAGASQT